MINQRLWPIKVSILAKKSMLVRTLKNITTINCAKIKRASAKEYYKAEIRSFKTKQFQLQSGHYTRIRLEFRLLRA